MTTNVLFVGDPHFKIKNIETIPLFISRILDTVDHAPQLNFVVVAGDLLDNHDRIDVEPFNLALKLIDSLRTKIKTFVLVGNHDYKNNQQFLSDHHWMNALKEWDNVTIVDKIIVETVGGFQFLFAPYVPPGRFIEAIESKIPVCDLTQIKAIFAHQEFYGCKMGPIESKCGDKWNDEWPIVISGHIHNKQWSQSNIYYPGSAMQHAFGQSVENTVSLLAFSEDEMQLQEIDLKMPKLIIKYLSVDDALKPLKFHNKEFRKYKIVLKGTQEEFQTFKKSPRYKQLLEEGFKIAFKLQLVGPSSVCAENRKKFIDVLHEKVKHECDPALELVFKKFMTHHDERRSA